jgi:hypothetical protein
MVERRPKQFIKTQQERKEKSLTAAQTTVLFEDAAHMGNPNATAVQLQVEGIVSVDDLADFNKDTIEQIAATANLRRYSD